MLHESGLLIDLGHVAFYNGEPLSLYGDPAYLLGVYLQGPLRGNNLTPQMELYNKSMNEVRVAVDLLFGNITNYFKFIGFKAGVNMKAVFWLGITFLTQISR